jgi:hypothetical protein
MNAERVDDLGRRADQIARPSLARAEKVLVAEIFGETAPPPDGQRPSTKRLTEFGGGFGREPGHCSREHIRHAADLDGQVKAAAKYAARIAMAEMLSGLRPAGDAIAQVSSASSLKSRWDLAGDFAPDMLRDMFLKYALKTGRGQGHRPRPAGPRHGRHRRGETGLRRRRARMGPHDERRRPGGRPSARRRSTIRRPRPPRPHLAAAGRAVVRDPAEMAALARRQLAEAASRRRDTGRTGHRGRSRAAGAANRHYGGP